MKNLVIVESPAKAKTIEKFLGKDYKVMSSYGHIRDLKKGDGAILKDDNFKPVYEVSDDKKELVEQLKKAAKEADMVWLASDEDREGEAIAWHLYEVLGLKPATTRRIVFHEITKDAILNAIANPRDIDINLVDAQQARRVLDRIVGFELSPVLWRKIKPALSAGRVQSVAVRLIVERENEIRNFKIEPYFRVSAQMTTDEGKTFRAELSRRLHTLADSRKFLEQCVGVKFKVGDVEVRPVKKSPAPPFTTSTLQQEASRKLGFSVSQTMMVAQRLYEAGHITYMRTDSLNLSSLAINAISSEIKSTLGERYLQVRHYHSTSKGAQEAHEAIRPTYIANRDIEGTSQEKRLYSLIWKRTLASQMSDAEIEKTSVEINAPGIDGHFNASGEVIKFDGFLKVYLEGNDDNEERTMSPFSAILPVMTKGEKVEATSITAAERFTQHPARYTEATLVKKMEELGIGRPSTYAPTISTIQQREYVTKGDVPGESKILSTLVLTDGKIEKTDKEETVGNDKGKLIPTDTGIIVNEFLTDQFPNVLDYNFTASVEEKFDDIAGGKSQWQSEIGDFYDVFHPEVEKANATHTEHKVGERVLGTDPKSGKQLSVKIGRFGPVVQIGSSNDEEKPRFASLQKDQSIFTITLPEALKLFELPRELGEFEGGIVTVATGRFGPYVRHNNKFVSIPKDMSPLEITFDEAVKLILDKREKDSKKEVKTFAEDSDMKILNGRYGVYISYKKANYKIPADVKNPEELTYDECKQIVEAQDSKPKTNRTSTRAKKK